MAYLRISCQNNLKDFLSSFYSHVVTHSAFEQSTNMNENINDHIERCIVHKLQNLIVIDIFGFFIFFLELVISI